MRLFELPHWSICGLTVFAMLTSFFGAAGVGCSAHDEPGTWEEAFLKAHARNVSAYGENILVISPGDDRFSLVYPASAALTIQDVYAIEKRCPSRSTVLLLMGAGTLLPLRGVPQGKTGDAGAK